MLFLASIFILELILSVHYAYQDVFSSYSHGECECVCVFLCVHACVFASLVVRWWSTHVRVCVMCFFSMAEWLRSPLRNHLALGSISQRGIPWHGDESKLYERN